ncbi:MAG: hypothetical protein HXY24_12590 [Rubrivivax sp.]|nr:hypothetical protein [Rubrivivax sp.]
MGYAQDPGWPRELENKQARLVYYQPQVDDWSDFKSLDFRMAFTLTPPNGKAVVGVVTIHGSTDVDLENRTVFIHDLAITSTSFPSLDPADAAKMDQLVRTFLPPAHTVTMSVERLVACVPKSQNMAAVQVKNDPPPIFVSYGPSVLLQLDGAPVRAAIPKTNLEFVVNTQLPVFLDKAGSKYYLFTGDQWLMAPRLEDTWTLAKSLPKEISKLPEDPQWAPLKSAIPPPKSKSSAVPKVFYTTSPSELVQIKGQPVYVKIRGTRLTYISNTESDLFVYVPTTTYYYLASGRWFRAASLGGPWTFASGELPPDFAQIPPDSPAARVLVSVPGTEEAKDAVLLAQIPTTIEVDPVKAAAQAKVSYSGTPEFKPIEGTTLYYATNTTDKVIKVGDMYYLCLQGIWFMSTTAEGPWTTASSIPREIYTIPPSSPVYNVTYVTQTTTPSGTVESSHTAGYLGAFVVGVAAGAIICGGTGYYYPPYYYYPRYAYPIYHPYPRTYGWAAYNPYTGTYARGVTTYGPYGSASAGRAYNPYTGTAAATRQASSPYGQWGGSVVAGQNQAVRTQHATTSQGTVARAQSTTGAKAVGISTDYGSAFAAKSSSGDLYAGKDGNVYKNTGDGWQKYEDGSWSSVDKPTSASAQSARSGAQTQGAAAYPSTTGAQQRAQSAGASPSATSTQPRAAGTGAQQKIQGYSGASAQASHTQSLNQEMQSRQRGSRYQSSQRSGGARRRR